ncbi:hypothetical protein Tco_0020541 [Tanacetum coccineum]
MIALLDKIDGSEGFHQIVDFLNVSHIRFALSENPTIYDSHIKQFWQTATINTLDNGEQEITAIVDGLVKTVTIASVRKYLQLADAGGLSSLPNTEIFDQLSLMEVEIPQSNFPTQTLVADEAAFTGADVVHGGAATTVSSIDAGQGSDNITKSPTMPHDSPLPRGHTPEDEGSMTLHELAILCTNLSNKVEVQGWYGHNLDTQEGFGAGPEVTTADAELNTASTFVSTASPQRHADTTSNYLTITETLMEIRKSAAKAKGKAKMDETESPSKMKQREQVQISRDAKVDQKLQEEFDAAERQRMAQVHQAAQGFTYAEWDAILARVAADEDFVQ